MAQDVTSDSLPAQAVLAALYDAVFGEKTPQTAFQGMEISPRIEEYAQDVVNIFSGWTYDRTPRPLALNHPEAQNEEVKALLATIIFFSSVLDVDVTPLLQNKSPVADTAYQDWLEICSMSGFGFGPDLHAATKWVLGHEPDQFGALVARGLGIDGDGWDKGSGYFSEEDGGLEVLGYKSPFIAWSPDFFGIQANGGYARWRLEGGQLRFS